MLGSCGQQFVCAGTSLGTRAWVLECMRAPTRSHARVDERVGCTQSARRRLAISPGNAAVILPSQG
eukprot:434306-Pleurochrysis_carterae.AAC.1